MTAYDRFNASKDAEKINIAFKGWKTDHQAITDILTRRSNQQRQEIGKYYMQHFGHDLLEDLRSGLTGELQDFMVALMRNPIEYLCMQLHSALLDKQGVNSVILVEALCTKNNDEIEKIIHTFEASEFMSQIAHIFALIRCIIVFRKCTHVRWNKKY